METIYKPSQKANKWAKYIDSLYMARPEFPFKDDFTSAIFRHADNQKWFGLIMNIPYNKLVDGKDGDVFVLNVKANPMVILGMIDQSHFFRAYHMNKVHWITILLDGHEPEDKVKLLIDMSYNLTKK